MRDANDTGDDAPRDDTIDSKITTHKGDASAHHAKTTSVSDLTDHDKAAHDALNIDADTVDGDHKTDLENTMDSKITTHKGDASAHHTKYTDAEAKAAAVQAGAITNGVTKAPTHDAVYDVKVTAETATTPAEVDAKINTHKGDASAHHAKTTSGEIDHGSVQGLADDDHTQYLNTTRHDTTTRHSLGTVVPHDSHGNLSGVTSDQHHPRSHDHSLAADGTPIAVAGVPNLPASKITSGRFGKSRLEWTAGKLLKGAGAGADPTEIDPSMITTGNYTGNETVNRAIAHGLGVTPKIVLITEDDGYMFRIHAGLARIIYQQATVGGAYEVTAMDATNFYVGNSTNYTASANGPGESFYWIAFG